MFRFVLLIFLLFFVTKIQAQFVKLSFKVLNENGAVLNNASIAVKSSNGKKLNKNCDIVQQVNGACFLAIDLDEYNFPLTLTAKSKGYETASQTYDQYKPIDNVTFQLNKEIAKNKSSQRQVNPDTFPLNFLLTDDNDTPLGNVIIFNSKFPYSRWVTNKEGVAKIRLPSERNAIHNFEFYLDGYEKNNRVIDLENKPIPKEQIKLVLEPKLTPLPTPIPDTIPAVIKDLSFIILRDNGSDASPATPIEGAEVVLKYQGEIVDEKITDELGRATFRFHKKESDYVDLVIYSQGFKHLSVTRDISGNTNVFEEEMIPLEADKKEVRIRAEVFYNGKQVKNIKVIARNLERENSQPHETKTDSEGRFVIPAKHTLEGDYVEFKFKKRRFQFDKIELITEEKIDDGLKFNIKKVPINGLKLGGFVSTGLGLACGVRAIAYYDKAKDCCNENWNQNRRTANSLIIAGTAKTVIGLGLLWFEKIIKKKKEVNFPNIGFNYNKDGFGQQHIGIAYRFPNR